jgi:hypothetical protein
MVRLIVGASVCFVHVVCPAMVLGVYPRTHKAKHVSVPGLY